MRFGRPPASRTGRAVAFLATALVFLCVPTAALAAEPFQKDRTSLPASVTGGETADSAETAAGGGGGSLVRMIVGLAVVIAVIYGVHWLLKTYGKAKGTQSDGRMNVVATTTLAPNRALHLVRIGEELVLVGSAEHGVTPVRVYAADEARRLSQVLAADDPTPLREPASGGPFLLRVVEDVRRRTARR